MANEVQFSFAAGKTCYFLVRNEVAQVWNSSGAGAFVNYSTAAYASFVNQTTEQGNASAYYAGNFPTAIGSGGVFSIVGKNQTGGSPLETDPTVAIGDLQWNGVAVLPLNNLATSGQIGQLTPIKLARGVMVQNFMFKLVSSADHITPLTSGVVSGQIVRDNGSFGALQSGAFTEIGLGYYRTNLTSGDLLCNTAGLSFSAAGADQRDFSLVLQRSSGA